MAKVIAKAKSKMSGEIKALMQSDPRQASKAIKYTVYKRLLGGNINILDKRKKSNTRCNITKTRKLDSNPIQRGGNRMKRTQRTEELDSYFGPDRGFILRFLTKGADRTNEGSMVARGGHNPAARRGKIAPLNWFERSSSFNLEKALIEFEKLVDEQITELTKEE